MKNIKRCSDHKKWYLKQQNFYFEYEYHNKMFYLFSKNEDSLETWVDSLNYAKRFYLWVKWLTQQSYHSDASDELKEKLSNLVNEVMHAKLTEVALDDSFIQTKKYTQQLF